MQSAYMTATAVTHGSMLITVRGARAAEGDGDAAEEAAEPASSSASLIYSDFERETRPWQGTVYISILI